MADVGGGGGFLSGVGAIVGGIASAIRGWLAITADQLLKLLNFLKTTLVDLAGKLVVGLTRLGGSVARLLRSLGSLIRDGLTNFFFWSAEKIWRLWYLLSQNIGGIIKFLDKVRRVVNDIYKTYVRPVLDTIDFIRQLNRVLETFHITLLSGLDQVLAEVERRIQEPFTWVQQQITRIDNFLDRIITLDGLVQKFTLLASMRKYAPDWMRTFWADQIGPARSGPGVPSPSDTYPGHDSAKDVVVMAEYFETGGGEAAGRIDELAIVLMQIANGTAPPELPGAEA